MKSNIPACADASLRTIPRDKGFYIAGFADGEGSFNTSFRRRDDYLLGWKIAPVFNISQKERPILALIKSHLKCGSIRFRRDGVWVYEVDNRAALRTQIIPFFRRYPFLSEKKKRDFALFQEIIEILDNCKHTTYPQLVALLMLLEGTGSHTSQRSGSAPRGAKKGPQPKTSRKHTRDEILERGMQFWARNQSKIQRLNL